MPPQTLVPPPPAAVPPAPPPAGREPRLPFVADLRSHGARVALVDGSGHELTYEALADRVDRLAATLGTTRRLIALAASNHVDAVVAYLAALRGHHPVLLVPGGPDGHLGSLVEAYRPDVVITSRADGLVVDERRPTSAHELHPDLALLLCTSGSTGSSKVARLSHQNLTSNAESIATYLGLTEDDRAATTLPMAYCYGLSVVNSHLARGASLLLTDLSVVDPCFWVAFTRHRATSFAAVPHTFELLDRAGFAELDLPHLRYVTQAGGRLAPDRVRRFAEIGRERGWDLFVMYGQTEATARMAYLPPDLAVAHPTTIGIPVPGGSFELVPVDGHDGPDEGELVYRGPNVMLGYANGPSDLAVGRTIDRLATGDVARRTDAGLYEVVGRLSRFVKIFGLRVDLDRLERLLREAGHHALCTGHDDRLAIATITGDGPAVARAVHERAGIPPHRIDVVEVDDLPRLPNGKPDHATVRLLADVQAAEPPAHSAHPARTVTDVFAGVLGTGELDPSATFVALGGDSLSYVEVSIGIEEVLGYVPDAWHLMPLSELARLEPHRRRLRRVETGVLMRAVAICLVVGSHTGLFAIWGGAHVLLAVAGFNFARFRLAATDTAEHVRSNAASIARMAVPSVAFIGALFLFADGYWLPNVALVNNYLADGVWRYWFWFVEALVHILVLGAVVFALPGARRFERRHPFGVAFGVLVASLALRLVPFGDPANQIYRTHSVLWLFVLGWAAQRATTVRQRLAVSAVALAAVPGFFGHTARDALVVAGLIAVIWVRQVAVPHPVNRVAGVLAGASLAIYLTHWLVFPVALRHGPPLVAVLVSLAVGIGVQQVGQRAGALVRQRWALGSLLPRGAAPVTPRPAALRSAPALAS